MYKFTTRFLRELVHYSSAFQTRQTKKRKRKTMETAALRLFDHAGRWKPTYCTAVLISNVQDFTDQLHAKMLHLFHTKDNARQRGVTF